MGQFGNGTPENGTYRVLFLRHCSKTRPKCKNKLQTGQYQTRPLCPVFKWSVYLIDSNNVKNIWIPDNKISGIQMNPLFWASGIQTPTLLLHCKTDFHLSHPFWSTIQVIQVTIVGSSTISKTCWTEKKYFVFLNRNVQLNLQIQNMHYVNWVCPCFYTRQLNVTWPDKIVL